MPGVKRVPPPRAPAAGVVDVIWCPNPLRPVAERQVRRLVLTGTDTVASVVQRLGLHGASLSVGLNACEVPRRRWGRKRVRVGDALVLTQRARGTETAALVASKIAEGAAWYEIAGAVLLAVLTSDLAIAIAVSVLANSLMSKRQPSAQPESALAAYSIEGGSNGLRPYAPLLLVLGEHRVFPDYASRPFGEFVPDEATSRLIVNNTPIYEDRVPPAWSYDEEFIPDPDTGGSYNITPVAPWTYLGTADAYFFYGDNQTRTYVLPGPGTAVMRPHTFIVRHVPGTDDFDAVTTYEDWAATYVPGWDGDSGDPGDGPGDGGGDGSGDGSDGDGGP